MHSDHDVAATETGTLLGGRLSLRQRLGSGAHGVVFAGRDHLRGLDVAIKRLHYVQPTSIYRLKREFRALADLSHPNLVQLYDLFHDGQSWFFTMERVDGIPLLEWLDVSKSREAAVAYDTDGARDEPAADATLGRAADGPPSACRLGVDVRRVRAAFRQLAEGVHALHLSGKLHRDLKSQNVLVDRGGRVVLLDFGLVHELGRKARDAADAEVVGTPLYMAPEQSAGTPIDEAADWYAVGVALYRSLIGAYPFDGRPLEVMLAKQTREPVPPCERWPGVPADLDLLCRDLLRRDPRARPSGREVLARLGATTRSAVALASGTTATGREFVGRHVELGRLCDGFEDVLRGRPRAFIVSGGSGVGKSALLRALVADVVRRRPDTVVLEGRCYASESLPYKALDAVVDDLMRVLARSPPSGTRELLPHDVAALAQIFPVLRRVPAVDEACERGVLVADPVERRRRAFDALRDLLASLSARAPFLVCIDDLQWGDADSAFALHRILAPPDAPALLFVGTCRDDELATSALLRAPMADLLARSLFVEIRLGPLTEEESLELALAALRERGVPDADAYAPLVVADAAGSPLLLEQLVELFDTDEARPSAFAGEVRVVPEAPASRAVPTLAAVVERRFATLPASARRVVEVLSVAARPTDARVVRAAAGVENLESAGLLRLRASRLVRELASDDGVRLDVYHDRIRETITERLGGQDVAMLHAALAAAHVASPAADPEVVAHHLRGAGDTRGALGYLVRAAERARAALAFDHAARLFRQALDLADPAVDAVVSLEEQLGDALRAAGRGGEAAEIYSRASRHVGNPALSVEFRRRAAEQLLFSGHVDRALQEIAGLLRMVGLSLPRGPRRALAEFVLRRAEVRLRALDRLPPVASDAADELALDLCWTLAIGLAMTDPVRAGVFQAQHLLLARRAGDAARYALALAVEVPFSATAGSRARQRTAMLTRRALAAAAEVEDPRLDGFLASSIAGAAWLEGRWRDGLEGGLHADALLRAHSAGTAWQAWQLDATAIVVCDCLLRLGRYRELSRHVAHGLADARARGDLFLELYLLTRFVPALRLVSSAPGAVATDAADAAARWTGGRFTVLHFWALCTRVEHALHVGDPAHATQVCREGAAGVRASLLLELQIYRATWLELQARARVALAARAAGDVREASLRDARSPCRALAGEGASWTTAMSALVTAGARAVAGDRAGARAALDVAERSAALAGLEATRAVAAARRAELDGADGALEAAHATLAALGVEDPGAFVERSAPGCYG